jgi:hypothetical protein
MWVYQIERDHEGKLPIGFAKSLVELYVKHPGWFTADNIKEWSETVPKLPKVPGTLTVTPPGEGTGLAAPNSNIAELLDLK